MTAQPDGASDPGLAGRARRLRKPGPSSCGTQRGRLKGTLHGFEVPYVFNIPAALVGADQVTPADAVMGDLASACWVTFAKTGDPNGGSRPAWPRHDPAVDQVLQFTNTGVVLGPDPLKARLDLWWEVWNAGR
jgi:para-nitrobenzyl esterase